MRVGVVIPAADEQERVARCLDGVLTARHRLLAERPGDGVEVVVVLDRCTDGTADIVAAYPGVRTVRCEAGAVGAARAAGSAAAGAADWYANTDADSLVPPGWLCHLAACIERGADLVLGTVLPGPSLPQAVRRAWNDAHQPGDEHPHVHGANLAVTAAALAATGGWRPLATGEDTDLARRATAAGLHVVRTGGVPVVSSARTTGRVPEGFSTYLRRLEAQQLAGQRSEFVQVPQAPPS